MEGRLFEGGVFWGTYSTYKVHVLSAGVLTYTFTYSSCSNTYFTLLLLETCTSPLYVLRYFYYYYHMKHSNRGVAGQELQYKSKLTKRKKRRREEQATQ